MYMHRKDYFGSNEHFILTIYKPRIMYCIHKAILHPAGKAGAYETVLDSIYSFLLQPDVRGLPWAAGDGRMGPA